MLSRTADNLYWMSRYMERAENVGRFLDVAFQMSLMPNAEPETIWRPILIIAGGAPDFEKRGLPVTADNVISYLARDPDNPSSIWSSIRTARENARAVRSTIPTEMWESLNATWLEIADLTVERLRETGFQEFFEWVKERSHLFRGVAYGTMLRDDCFHFARLGTFVERADNTARLLDVKYHVLLPAAHDVGGVLDHYQWAAVLRSVSAFKAYRSIYRDFILPARVAELLIIREDMPRSLHSCLDQVVLILDTLAPRSECWRLAGELHAHLHYGRIDAILARGLHEFLTEFVGQNVILGDEIHSNFMMEA